MGQAIFQKHLTERYESKNDVSFNFQLQEGEFFKEVIIRHGFIVDGVGFVISNPHGGTYTRFYGGDGGQESRIRLGSGEKITKLSGTYGNYKYQRNECLVASIKIHTNEHPNGYGPYGQGDSVDCPRNFETPSSIDGPIVGVFGRHNNYLQSVDIIVNKEIKGHNSFDEQRKQVTTSVSLSNETNTGTVRFLGNMDWSGSITSQCGYYPRLISDNNTCEFYHQGSSNGNSSEGGSMGAVIYIGPAKVGGPDCIAWLLAWSVPGNASPNKVFLDCGNKCKFRHANWAAVKRKLIQSAPAYEKEHVDPHTGAMVYANIENDDPKSTYELNVVFSVKH